MDELELLDWKRQIFALYAEVRAAADARAAWNQWRDVRDELFRAHPQSPLPPETRTGFGGLDYFDYDPGLRISAEVAPAEPEARAIGASGGGGRYLLDTVKGADLGGDATHVVLDFNFAYNPSCSYDPRWVCPLTPPANRLALPVEAGERHPHR